MCQLADGGTQTFDGCRMEFRTSRNDATRGNNKNEEKFSSYFILLLTDKAGAGQHGEQQGRAGQVIQ